MSKKIVLSFDDGRLDTFENAIPIMDKYGIPATINITTDFILHPNKYCSFKSAGNKAMSVDQIQEIYKKGYEIASHGNEHLNNPDDIRKSVELLHEWGVEKVYGFASPTSAINENNFSDFKILLDEGTLSYIRSGLQVRQQGLLYTGLYVIQNVVKSNYLFWRLNKRLVIKDSALPLLEYGISVSKDTTVDQIIYLINKMPQDSMVILILHSILSKDASGYGLDKWYWSKTQFEELCSRLSNHSMYRLIRNNDAYKA